MLYLWLISSEKYFVLSWHDNLIIENVCVCTLYAYVLHSGIALLSKKGSSIVTAINQGQYFLTVPSVVQKLVKLTF